MTVSIRRIGARDEEVLASLARDDANFDVEGRGRPLEPLSPEATRDYLNNPSVLHWVAFEQNTPIGFLVCMILPLRAGSGSELLLYEIGVHNNWRRRGIGRMMLDKMRTWMETNVVKVVWVLADNPDAEAFYKSCGFTTEEGLSVYLVLNV